MREFGVAQSLRPRQHSKLDIFMMRKHSADFFLLKHSCWVLRSCPINIFGVPGVAHVFFVFSVGLLQNRNFVSYAKNLWRSA